MFKQGDIVAIGYCDKEQDTYKEYEYLGKVKDSPGKVVVRPLFSEEVILEEEFRIKSMKEMHQRREFTCHEHGHLWGKVVETKLFQGDSYIPEPYHEWSRTCVRCGAVETSEKPFESEPIWMQCPHCGKFLLETDSCCDFQCRVCGKRHSRYIDADDCCIIPDDKIKAFKYMDCSTAHVTADDLEWLTNTNVCMEAGLHAVYWYEEGFWVHIPTDRESMEDLEQSGFSPAFVKLIKAAKRSGCFFLRLDRDGTVYDLPQFDN